MAAENELKTNLVFKISWKWEQKISRNGNSE